MERKKSLVILRDLINDGIDARNFLNDILEIIYLFSRRINLGLIEKDMTISETEAQIINENSENIDMQDIGLFWQLTIKTIDDLRIVGSEHLTLEMYVMQLTHIINIESNTKIDSHDNTNLNLKRKKFNK